MLGGSSGSNDANEAGAGRNTGANGGDREASARCARVAELTRAFVDGSKAPRIRNAIITLMGQDSDLLHESSGSGSGGSGSDSGSEKGGANAVIDKVANNGGVVGGEGEGKNFLQRLARKQQSLNYAQRLDAREPGLGGLAVLTANTVGKYKNQSTMSWLSHYVSVVTAENSCLEKKVKELEAKCDLMKINMDYDKYKEADSEVQRRFGNKLVNVDTFVRKREAEQEQQHTR